MAALAKQSLPAREVLVVIRLDDPERKTIQSIIAGHSFVRPIWIDGGGTVAALASGLAASSGHFVAFTDDDAAPRPDWLARAVSILDSDCGLAAVGGRDVIHSDSSPPRPGPVGMVTWYGRVVGNHHLGAAGMRYVDALKGVNLVGRRSAFLATGLDRRLRGAGAQVHWELDLCLALRRQGWRLAYDPALLVDHEPAPRFDADQRASFDSGATRDAVHNETMVLMQHLRPWAIPVFALWAVLVGTRGSPGIAQSLRLWRQLRRTSLAKCRATLWGRATGAWEALTTDRMPRAVP